MVRVSGDADPFAPSDPQAHVDHEAIIDRSGFVARVGPSVDRAHDLAHDIVGDAQVAAQVVREVFDSLWARRDELTDDDLRHEPILLATRTAALDRRTARPVPATAATSGIDQPSSASRHRVELAQAGAAVLGADDASVLDLHLRHGLGAETLAAPLGVAADDAPQRLARLRSRLDDALAAFTLWRGGSPACAGLAAALNDGTTLDDGRFDIVVFDVVGAHRATCADCARLHRSIVNPIGMFATAPVMAVAPSMRDRMLSSNDAASPTPEPVAPVPRRDSDDTPTALLWAAADLPARPRTAAPAPAPARPRALTPIIDARIGDWRRVLAGVAAALLLLLAGGAVIAVRGSSGDDVRSDATTTTAGPTASTEPEVRALGPVPPVVVTADTTTTTTTTVPPDTTEPETSDPDTSAPETTAAAPVPVTTAPRRSSSTPTTTTAPVVDPGTPLPPPPTAPAPTTTSPTTTTQTTTATTTTTTTTAPTTTAVTTTVATTTAPTTAAPTTAAPTTAAPTTAAPTTAAPTTAATTTLP